MENRLPVHRNRIDLEGFTFRDWPFYWLARAGGFYFQNMAEELRPLGLDLPRWRVLMTLHEEKTLSVSELAEHAIVKLPTMTKIVQRMQLDGYVSAAPSQADARVTEVTLTESGRAAGEAAWQAANEVYGRAFSKISKTKRDQLTQLLRELADNLANG